MLKNRKRSARTVWESANLSLFLTFLISTGCVTEWKEAGSFHKAIQTTAHIVSVPSGRVTVDNRYVGDTPLDVPLQYEQEVIRKERKVSYWKTQPGFSLLLTISSCGLYLPFSGIAVDEQSTQEARHSYRGNEFRIGVTAPGRPEWSQVLRPKGEPETHVRAAW